ncbi:prenyl diphosphate phosphatase [Coprinopsis marcescibilis]|uniref:Prenyl diphosphate phosphatase n=1 Tax=Coprinopsis marcescibilis TaxID=230819 RepID=A0A5C3KY07_COPMA|nr:prenyl diphosphate phosphatase [Coprinopsis marcescibilis]
MATANTTAATTSAENPATMVDRDRHANRGYRNGTGTEKSRAHRPAGPRFRFGSWLRLHGFDILTMAAMGAVALGLHFAGPAASRRPFGVFNLDGSIMHPDLGYPLRDSIIPLYGAVLISFFVPWLFIALFQIKRKSVDDWFTTTLGLLRSLITAAVIQTFIKWLIGGLRPHFYSVCQPRVGSGGELGGTGFQGGFFDRSICTGNNDMIDEAMQSFPSGHATASWAGLFFLALYFNAQLKVTAAHNPAYWKMIMFFAPLLGAFLISASKIIDRHHHWYDLVVGGLIGISTALIAFRQTFASIFDYRFNHILLPRATSFFHRKQFLPFSNRGPYFNYQNANEFTPRDLPVSREGGWGHGGFEGVNGAPSDATALIAGNPALLGGQGLHAATGAMKDAIHGRTGPTDTTGGVLSTGNNAGHTPFGQTAV